VGMVDRQTIAAAAACDIRFVSNADAWRWN
jgi:hypothetical protein